MVQSGAYDAQSDLHQIGVMVENLPVWPELGDDALTAFVSKLLEKEFPTASDAVRAIPA